MTFKAQELGLTTPEMVQMYEAGVSSVEIAKHARCSQTAVAYRLTRAGIIMRPAIGPTYHSLDHTFFDQIDTSAKAYILGLLITDGGILESGSHSVVYFHLKPCDRDILEQIRGAMRMSVVVHERPKYVELSWTSRPQLSALKKLGVTVRKSFVAPYPSVPTELERHLLRGILDGDGWVWPNRFGLCGSSLALVQGAREAIIRRFPDDPLGAITTSHPNGKPHYRWNGYRHHVPILHWLYDDASLVLARKSSVVKEHW